MTFYDSSVNFFLLKGKEVDQSKLLFTINRVDDNPVFSYILVCKKEVKHERKRIRRKSTYYIPQPV